MSCVPVICVSATLKCGKGGIITIGDPGQSKFEVAPPALGAAVGKEDDKGILERGFDFLIADDARTLVGADSSITDRVLAGAGLVPIPLAKGIKAITHARKLLRAKKSRKLPINQKKQNEHLRGTSEYDKRLKKQDKDGKTPQTAWKTKSKRKANRLTRKAHKKGDVLERHPPKDGETAGQPKKIRHKRRRKVGERGEREITVHCRAPQNGGECHGHPSGPKR